MGCGSSSPMAEPLGRGGATAAKVRLHLTPLRPAKNITYRGYSRLARPQWAFRVAAASSGDG